MRPTRRLAQRLPPGQSRGTDPVVVALIDRFPPWFRAAPAWSHSRQWLHKTAPAVPAEETPTGDHQLTGPAEARQMAHSPFIPALAAEAAASAARALSW